MKTVQVSSRKTCAACDRSQFEQIFEFPSFPLTGIYVKQEERAGFPEFNLRLCCCSSCGHVQLEDSIDPAFLYQDTYTHRSSLSAISTSGNDFFYEFVQSQLKTQETHDKQAMQTILEIGCNDLYLLKKFKTSGMGQHLYGFDPIWKDRALPQEVQADSQFKILGRYLEEVNYVKDFPNRPDVIVTAHTLEHVEKPLIGLKPLIDYANPGAWVFVEVPGFDSLVKVSRFDQVFHQHLNYFSLASMNAMLTACGLTYVSHCFNHRYWQGTMLVAYRKKSSQNAHGLPKAPSVSEIRKSYDFFKNTVVESEKKLQAFKASGMGVYGFGAAQMVPSLVYHAPERFSVIEKIFDDHSDRQGLYYPGFDFHITAPDPKQIRDGVAVITALDSTRSILNRLLKQPMESPRMIFNLLNWF